MQEKGILELNRYSNILNMCYTAATIYQLLSLILIK